MTNQTTEPSSERAELKPCPFCGGRASSTDSGHTASCYFTQLALMRNDPPGDVSRAPDVVAAWNARALLSSDAKPVQGENEYFAARPQIDSADRRNVFRAGLAAGRSSDAPAGGDAVADGSWDHLKLMMEESAWDGRLELTDALSNIDDFAKSYTHPQPARTVEPLTAVDGWVEINGMQYREEGVRAIEAAHGITAAPKPQNKETVE